MTDDILPIENFACGSSVALVYGPICVPERDATTLVLCREPANCCTAFPFFFSLGFPIRHSVTSLAAFFCHVGVPTQWPFESANCIRGYDLLTNNTRKAPCLQTLLNDARFHYRSKALSPWRCLLQISGTRT